MRIWRTCQATLLTKIVYLNENQCSLKFVIVFLKFNSVGSQNTFELKELDCSTCNCQECRHLFMCFTKQVSFSHELAKAQKQFSLNFIYSSILADKQLSLKKKDHFCLARNMPFRHLIRKLILQFGHT